MEQLAGAMGLSLDAVREAAGGDDRRVTQVLATAADVLGRALAATITTINPDRLVLGGKIGSIECLVDHVRTRVMADVADRIADGLAVEEGDPGDGSAIHGLATLVMRKVFAPAAIDAAVSDFLAS